MAYTFTLEAPALELELKKLIVQENRKKMNLILPKLVMMNGYLVNKAVFN